MKRHLLDPVVSLAVPHSRGGVLVKKAVLLLAILFLSGCTYVQDSILHRFGDMSEEDYEAYIELRDSGSLDENGHYQDRALEAAPEFSPPDGSVHVTFAKNAYIDVEYYLDPNLKTKADQESCYLTLGDSIYYAPEMLVCKHPSSRWYSFDRFCIYTYNGDGERDGTLPWTDSEEGTSLVFQIPDNYTGTEISIVPMGKYEIRSIELTDYYMDSSGQAQELAGTWIINDQETANKTIQVSPVDPLAVDFKYDPEKYSFVASTPSSFYHENGLVRFETTYASENIECYSVELRSLGGTFLFDPSQYPVEHGAVSFNYQGRSITEQSYIPDGGTIQYVADPNEGYRHPQTTGQIVVNASEPDKTAEKITEAVRFYPDELVEVILPRPIGGTIQYTVDGEVLSGDRCKLPCGTTITMNFEPWNRWQIGTGHNGEAGEDIENSSEIIEDSAEYIVKEVAAQTVSLPGIDINTSLFTESERYKPTLNVILTDSVEDVNVRILTYDSQEQTSYRYEAGDKTTFIPDWLGQTDRLIFSSKVGTYQGITLKIYNSTVVDGEALRLNIDITDKDGVKNSYIRYMTGLPSEETIDLYDESSLTTATRKSLPVYETITVTISRVRVSTYTDKVVDHASVTAVLCDMTEPYTLKAGDVLEPSRKVQVTITPETGYYVTGTKGGSTYSETIKYSDWEKALEKLLNKHPIQKIWYVTLDDSDSYGTCVYKLDGVEVSGRIGLREGQKLTLEYTLTDSNYQIVREGPGGFFGGLLHSITERFSIPVSASLDGNTIKRSDYITIEGKEG